MNIAKRKLVVLVVVAFSAGAVLFSCNTPASYVADPRLVVTTDEPAPNIFARESEPAEEAPPSESKSDPPPPPPPPSAADRADPDSHIHIVFPSGCNAFQQWQVLALLLLSHSYAISHKQNPCIVSQAELLLHSHQMVGQKGKITRIVHGCEDNSQIKNMKHLPHPGGGLLFTRK